MMSATVRTGVGAAMIAVLTVTATACTNAHDSDREASATPTTVVEPTPTIRPSCEVQPAAWREAIEGSGVDTGGGSTKTLAVGPAGEVAAVRDNGDTRDLLLIGADKAVTKVYSVPDPNRNDVLSVTMDADRIVVGVYHAPRNANGVLETLTRVDVIDRHSGPIRTVVQESDTDLRTGGPTLDSVALFGDTVYWITRDTFAGDTGTLRSYDLGTGAVADVESGTMRNVRATPAGIAWEVAWGNTGTRAKVKNLAALPPAIAAVPGIDQDQLTLVTDGTAYTWITGLDQGGTGIALWSPDTGLVRVPIRDMFDRKYGWVPPVFLDAPYVVIGGLRPSDHAASGEPTIVDTRSGAITFVDQLLITGAGGGTIATQLKRGQGKLAPGVAGVVRTDALPPLAC